MSSARIASLIRLGDASLDLPQPAEDLRGREVVDNDAMPVGRVQDLMVDSDERHVRFLIVTVGGFAGSTGRELLVPVDALTYVGHVVIQIDRGREEAAGAPSYDPVLAGDAGYCAGIYGWYGFPPFWHPDYRYPAELFSADAA